MIEPKYTVLSLLKPGEQIEVKTDDIHDVVSLKVNVCDNTDEEVPLTPLEALELAGNLITSARKIIERQNFVNEHI